MRQGQQNRRGRGRNNNGGHSNHSHNHNANQNQHHNNRKPQSLLSKNYESTGPEVKIRGTAQHIAEKYMHLARDASSSGDFIMAENYLQHAEHYNRIIMAAQTAAPQPQSQPQPAHQNGAAHQPSYPHSTADGVNGNVQPHRQTPVSRQPADQADAGVEDALPNFVRQSVALPSAPAESGANDAEGERDENAPRQRRRRRPANGPEGRGERRASPEINGHAGQGNGPALPDGGGLPGDDA